MMQCFSEFLLEPVLVVISSGRIIPTYNKKKGPEIRPQRGEKL
jgi:hypothetical protein